MQQLLYIGKSRKGKIPHIWLLNIEIPKPPYISSLKIIGLLHFWKILGPSEEIYNPQSLWITLYVVVVVVVDQVDLAYVADVADED